MIKAGEEKAGHKYASRKMGPGGHWIYEYADDQQAFKHASSAYGSAFRAHEKAIDEPDPAKREALLKKVEAHHAVMRSAAEHVSKNTNAPRPGRALHAAASAAAELTGKIRRGEIAPSKDPAYSSPDHTREHMRVEGHLESAKSDLWPKAYDRPRGIARGVTFTDLIKGAKGEERAGHQYSSRHMGAGGHWIYEYAQTAHAHYYDQKHPHPSGQGHIHVRAPDVRRAAFEALAAKHGMSVEDMHAQAHAHLVGGAAQPPGAAKPAGPKAAGAPGASHAARAAGKTGSLDNEASRAALAQLAGKGPIKAAPKPGPTQAGKPSGGKGKLGDVIDRAKQGQAKPGAAPAGKSKLGAALDRSGTKVSGRDEPAAKEAKERAKTEAIAAKRKGEADKYAKRGPTAASAGGKEKGTGPFVPTGKRDETPSKSGPSTKAGDGAKGKGDAKPEKDAHVRSDEETLMLMRRIETGEETGHLMVPLTDKQRKHADQLMAASAGKSKSAPASGKGGAKFSAGRARPGKKGRRTGFTMPPEHHLSHATDHVAMARKLHAEGKHDEAKEHARAAAAHLGDAHDSVGKARRKAASASEMGAGTAGGGR